MTDPYSHPPQDPYAPQPPEPPTNPYAAQPVSPPPAAAVNPPTIPYGQPPVSPAQPGYYQPQPGYQQQPGYPVGPQQNSMALVAMILALAGIATYITAPIGAILGHVAMKQIKQTGESGEGMAKAGIIVGWIITVLPILICCGLIAIGLIVDGTSPNDYNYDD